MREAINKAARLVINHCIEHKIGTIVFAWNQGQRPRVELGKTNQSFVQIPTARVKQRVRQLCEQYGIRFVEVAHNYNYDQPQNNYDSLKACQLWVQSNC
jgi:IS605 OrfB family transposase